MKKQITIIVLILMLSGCSNSTTPNNSASNDNSTIDIASSSDISSDDSSTNIDQQDTNTITFGNTITSTNDEVKIEGNQVTITEPGEYTLTGSSSDANIVFDLSEDDDIIINLDNLSLTASTNAPIYIAEGNSVEINLIGESSLEDSSTNQEMQAPIFIDEVETIIQGDGILNLTGNAQEGFENNNEMTIESGTLNITAQDDGINTGDGLTINGGNINIDCSGDGIDSNGFLEINGGTITVSGGNNGNGPLDFGENAEDYFELNGGTLISTGGNMGVSPTGHTQNYMASTTSGTTITIDGTEYEAPKSFSYFFISTADLSEDSIIEVDGSEVAVELNTSSTISGGEMGDSAIMNPPTQF